MLIESFGSAVSAEFHRELYNWNVRGIHGLYAFRVLRGLIRLIPCKCRELFCCLEWISWDPPRPPALPHICRHRDCIQLTTYANCHRICMYLHIFHLHVRVLRGMSWCRQSVFCTCVEMELTATLSRQALAVRVWRRARNDGEWSYESCSASLCSHNGGRCEYNVEALQAILKKCTAKVLGAYANCLKPFTSALCFFLPSDH